MPHSAKKREELIRRYEGGPGKLADALARVPKEALQWRPGPEKWSVHEVICHCADSETNGAMRIRYLLAEEDPLIVGYDQAHWAKAFDYHALPLEPALRTVEAVRRHTAGLLRRTPPEAWSRTGKHTESGSYSAEQWLETYAEHLEKHARQIERNLDAWRAEDTHPG
jgi:DinB superfamily